MNEVKHTPGPWTFETVKTQSGICHKIGPFPWKNGKQNHACIYVDYASAGPIERELRANARLIVAAPDLLEALEDLKRELILSDVDLDYIESHFRPWLNKAESAVAKARDYLFSPMPVIAKATQ